jgi:hypothetical protein
VAKHTTNICKNCHHNVHIFHKIEMCNNMISILTNISNILKDVHIVPNLKNND